MQSPGARGEADLATATRAALAGMYEHIEIRNGKYWVPNPAHKEENFADKWNDYPPRREAFVEWHQDISAALDDVINMKGAGIPAITARLEKSFGRNEIRRSAQSTANASRSNVKLASCEYVQTDSSPRPRPV
jgi:hypothetical protein